VELIVLLTKGTPFFLLALLINAVVSQVQMRQINKSLDNMKADIVWKDTYDERRRALDGTIKDIKAGISRLENGKLRGA